MVFHLERGQALLGRRSKRVKIGDEIHDEAISSAGHLTTVAWSFPTYAWFIVAGAGTVTAVTHVFDAGG